MEQMVLCQNGDSGMKSYRTDAVIFDFDGVIADTRDDVWASVEYAAERIGGVMDSRFMEDSSHVALPEKELLRHIIPIPDDDRLESFCDAIKVHYRTINPFLKTRMYPGIQEAFGYLKDRNIPWVVVSSKPEQALKRLIQVKGWEDLIPIHYSLDSISGADTKQAVYEALMGCELKQRNPVCIGDTWSDVAAAHRCGFPCIAVTYGDGDKDALMAQAPEYKANTGWELLRLLKHLIERNTAGYDEGF